MFRVTLTATPAAFRPGPGATSGDLPIVQKVRLGRRAALAALRRRRGPDNKVVRLFRPIPPVRPVRPVRPARPVSTACRAHNPRVLSVVVPTNPVAA